MQVVAAHNTVAVPVENGRSAISLQTGTDYVMHDVEVAGGRRAGAFEHIKPLPARPRRFEPDKGPAGRMILPFIGGMGDAVSMLPVLTAISRRHPRLRVDIATTPGPAEVFRLSSRVNGIIAYPPVLETWRGYDHFLSLEVVHQSARPGRALTETIADAIGVDLAGAAFELKLPQAIKAVDRRPAVPMVGVAVGDGLSVRSYPQRLLRELVARLVQQGLCSVLLGHADPAWNIPVCPPVITDMRSKTPTVLELAIWLRAVDVVVCHDSFVMHLAGALGRPVVALFAPTSRAHASPYPNAVALSSGEPCSPCHTTAARCPRGFDRCVAWDSRAVAPEAVAAEVLDQLRNLGRLGPETPARKAA